MIDDWYYPGYKMRFLDQGSLQLVTVITTSILGQPWTHTHRDITLEKHFLRKNEIRKSM